MKNYLIRVNGNEYEVEVEEIGSKAVSQMPVQENPEPKTMEQKPKVESKPIEKKVVPQGAETIDAPMPGNILSVDVSEGDSVMVGQVLIILEAMKMENEIVAPRDGKIANILVSAGASVDGGESLLTIE